MSIETEAVRVAAAAAAMVEDRHRTSALGEAGRRGRGAGRKWWAPIELVLGMVREERARQEAQWGDRPRSSGEWLMILAERVGALAVVVDAPGEGGADPRPLAVRQALVSAGQEAERWVAEHP